ncbi:MAG: MlaE family lipid ABC transporter permease subunit [bacterium]|nr:MlaE family lipid ABC transporter permease subunit [bacterium]
MWHRAGGGGIVTPVGEPFEIEEVAVGPTGNHVRVAGQLTVEHVGRLREELERVIRIPSSTRIDLSGVERLDGGAAAVLAESWSRAMMGGAAVAFEGARGSVAAVLDLYTDRLARECLRPPPARIGIFEQVGRATNDIFERCIEILEFLGQVMLATFAFLRRPRSLNWPDVGRLMERHGADGLPITLTIAFLIGSITAYQAALQLKQFGADIFVGDLVSLSLTRELAPLMTAIVIAGRSGAAIAAEIGTMRVSEEIDALETLGLCPYRFLVFPRVFAVVLVLPVLTLLADVVGIFGGLLIAISQLEVSTTGYLLSVQAALDPGDVIGGLLKACVFGAILSMQACERGMATRGGAEGVGRSTTSAVVATLFLIVVADAIFTVLFDLLGI